MILRAISPEALIIIINRISALHCNRGKKTKIILYYHSKCKTYLNIEKKSTY
jgi:hypothetical protein